jgi:hypothetical protein
MHVSDDTTKTTTTGDGAAEGVRKKAARLAAVVPIPEARELSDAHREHLRGSGLSDETLDLAKLYTERTSTRVAELLSWTRWPHGTALVFPFFVPGKLDPVMYRVRPSAPRINKAGKSIKYEQPKGIQVAPYFPPRARTSGAYADAARPVLWTEGEKKSLLLDQLGYAAVGGTGVSCFHDAEHRYDTGAWRLHALLREHVTLAGREHRIVFDSDSEQNDQVMNAARRLAGMLLAAGAASVRFVRIPMGEGGKKLGVDDYFVTFGEEATRSLLEQGCVDIDPLPVEEPHTPLRSLRALRGAPVSETLAMPDSFAFGPNGELFERGVGEAADELVALRPLLIKRILVDHKTGRESVELAFPREGVWRTATVDRAVVCNSRRIVDDLAAVGAPVDSNNAGAIVGWLRVLEATNERRLPRTLSVDACGWHEVDGEQIFMAPEQLGGEREVVFDGGLGRTRMVRGLRAKGNLDAHLVALRSAFAADRIAATAICAALAAPLLHVLDAPSFAVHLVGDSSRGKSSMLKIAASVYGDPGSEDWVPSWNSTSVGLEQRAATLCDLPFCVDEAGVVDAKEREKAVYMLIDGTGRTRGARGGGLRDTASWRTIVLSTGEHGLVDEDANTGAQVRVMQFHVAGFGALDAGGVDALRSACGENFGEVGRAWLTALASWSDDTRATHREGFRQYARAVRARAAKDGLRSRQAEYIAVLGYAESLASQILGLGSDDGETMIGWVIEGDGAARERRSVESVADRGLGLIQDWISGAPGSFPRIDIGVDGFPEAKTSGVRELAGYIGRDGVSFIPTKLRAYLGGHGIDWQVVREWTRRGWLVVTELERGTDKIRVNGGRVRVVRMRREIALGEDESVAVPWDSSEKA